MCDTDSAGEVSSVFKDRNLYQQNWTAQRMLLIVQSTVYIANKVWLSSPHAQPFTASFPKCTAGLAKAAVVSTERTLFAVLSLERFVRILKSADS